MIDTTSKWLTDVGEYKCKNLKISAWSNDWFLYSQKGWMDSRGGYRLKALSC